MDNRYYFRTFEDIPGVYEIADNTITNGFNPAVAVFATDEADNFEDINCYCGLENPKQYRSFNSWSKDVKKMFGITVTKRTWEHLPYMQGYYNSRA
jgi:hypothetical protein